MFKITAQECKKSTSGWRASLKNVVVSCENNAENGIYSPLMKVISNTILFVYSLSGALIKIARVYHTQWYNYFDGTTPLLEKVRRYLVAFLAST